MLKAAAHGYLAVDHRFLHAILDRPEASVPDLVRFGTEHHTNDAIELDDVLLDIFRYLRTPEALPFLMDLIRGDVDDVPDELVEAVVPLGAAAIDPLLEILREIEAQDHDSGEIWFLLSQLRVPDARIPEALKKPGAELFLEMYNNTDGSKEVDEPFDIWTHYPEQDDAPVDMLPNEERLALLDHPSAELRIGAVITSRGPAQDDKLRARLLQVAKTDPDAKVRGEAWESLEELKDEPELRRAMMAVLTDGAAPIEERGGTAVALAQHSDVAAVFEAIEALYSDPLGRAKALKAMGRSFDKRFAAYPPQHLDDPYTEIKRQAIWATGYLGLSSEASRLLAFFQNEEFRTDAIFAYALCVPAEISRGRVRSLLDKIDELADGLRTDELEMVEVALDQRLVLRGKKPVFSPDESDDEPGDVPAVSTKIGRNDPCPCGSGKKYKKCCGA